MLSPVIFLVKIRLPEFVDKNLHFWHFQSCEVKVNTVWKTFVSEHYFSPLGQGTENNAVILHAASQIIGLFCVQILTRALNGKKIIIFPSPAQRTFASNSLQSKHGLTFGRLILQPDTPYERSRLRQSRPTAATSNTSS